MDEPTAERYLARIGASRPDRPDVAGLTHLVGRHLASVPFENLSIHLGETIGLDEQALLTKIVDRRRGGFCYELNGALGLLLGHLGFAVTLLAARVFDGDRLTAPFAHLALRVDLDGTPWLADVGFGRFLAGPVRLDLLEEQHDPAGVVRIVPAGSGDLDVHLDGRPQVRLEARARDLADFGPTCWYQQASPDSHFVQSLTCSLPTPDGRVTLSDRLLIRTVDGVRTETELGDDDAVLAAYAEEFGIVLDRLPTPPSSRTGT